jgi:hypothetical protein
VFLAEVYLLLLTPYVIYCNAFPYSLHGTSGQWFRQVRIRKVYMESVRRHIE